MLFSREDRVFIHNIPHERSLFRQIYSTISGGDNNGRLATLPRQQEWEDYVAMFQNCAEGATSDEKWQMMERMFHLYD